MELVRLCVFSCMSPAKGLDHWSIYMFATIKPTVAAILNLARTGADDKTRKAIKKDLFAQVKADFSIDPAIKVKVETDATRADYLVLKRSDNGAKFALGADGKWNGATDVAKRWFAVDAEDLKDLVAETSDWDIGYDDKPEQAAGDTTVYVQLTEADFPDFL